MYADPVWRGWCRCIRPLARAAVSAILSVSCGVGAPVSSSSRGAVIPPRAEHPTAVLTGHNDNARTGANLGEVQLSTETVNRDQFGLLFSRPVNGQIYAQPLFIPDVTIPGKGKHHALLVATEQNHVYLFDADDPEASAPYWDVYLGEPVPSSDIGCNDLAPSIGVTATPAIDTETSIVYVVAKSRPRPGVWAIHLHALDLATGAHRLGGRVEIAPAVPGSGDGSVGGVVAFDALHQLARPALTLVNKTLWMAFGGHCDIPPYHGWVLAYDAATLKLTGVFNDTPNGAAGGIWQSGAGLAADDEGAVYAVTGNGTFDLSTTPPSYGDSILKLRLDSGGVGGGAPGGASVVDYFTPFNQEQLAAGDSDLGSSGPMILPGTGALLFGSKEGKLYLVDRQHMGGFDPVDDSHIIQSFVAVQGDPGRQILGKPVFWQGAGGGRVYVWGQDDDLRMYRFDEAGLLVTTAASTSTMRVPEGIPGGILSVSSNGTAPGSAIVWATHPVRDNSNGVVIVDGVLRAFDADDLEHELWNSEADPADAVGLFAKFCPPTVANGKVYVATFADKLQVYGLR